MALHQLQLLGLGKSAVSKRARAGRDAGLPTPEVNVWLTLGDGSADNVDFLWRRERLVVETDGHLFPSHQAVPRAGHEKRRAAAAGRFEPVRFTGRQVVIEKEWVTRTLLALASRVDGDGSRRAGAQAA
ncbi:MAG TPA: hypothetical protein VF056_15740 [Thermoleophilaceae bacterium]